MQIGIMLENPWLLTLFPVLAAFIILSAKNLNTGSMIRKRISIMLRLLLVFCLVLAISGLTVAAKANRTVTLFVADISDSVRDRIGEMEAFINEAMSGMTNRDTAGIISFAGQASVILLPQEKKGFSNLYLQQPVEADQTDIQNAMTLARSVMPENAAKRLVLITDGKETKGDAVETARMLNHIGYTINVVPFVSDQKAEVQLDEFTAPKQVSAKERFDVNVKIYSNIGTEATVRLFANRTLTAEKKVQLYHGENLFTFSDKVEQGGMVTYTAEVVAADDTILQNNRLSAFTQVIDRPRVLLVERGNGGENLVHFIDKYAQVTRVQPDEVPSSLDGMLVYDAFILSDISAEWLDPDFLVLLERAVQYQGKGLLTIGGENSYAPGGYNSTPLETILPVNMDIRPKDENPDLGLILVIDKSGSMASGEYGITKLELAKEAAIRAADVLEETDQLGVIAFDDAIQWVIKTDVLKDLDDATNMIGTIRPGGGTQILHPLQEAWQNLRTKDTKLKHIILLTDGQAERYGYERIIDGIRKDGITLSTVAVGQSADTLLLKALAYGGGGRYYWTDEFSDIPSIFAKETFLAGQKYLQNRHFYPELVTSAGILKGIEAIPPLDGYVATRAKSTARTVFRSDTQDPVLAVWQYGLGRTAAWTSDIKGVWTSQWSIWEQAGVFWGNLTSWLVQKNLNPDYYINAKIQDGKGVITVSTEKAGILGTDFVSGTVVCPDGTEESIRLDAVKPGTFEGTIEKGEPGAYVIHLKIDGENGAEDISTGIVMPYSEEYRILNDSTGSFLEKLAIAGGGIIVNSPEDIFGSDVQNIGAKRELTDLLILLALVLLLIDIAFRRLRISAERIVLIWHNKVGAKLNKLVNVIAVKRNTKIIFNKQQTEAQSYTNPGSETVADVKEPKSDRHKEQQGSETGLNNTVEAEKHGKVSIEAKQYQEVPGTTKQQARDNEGRAQQRRDSNESKVLQQIGRNTGMAEHDYINALLNRRKKWK
jgi:Mg-chelatase subunit ChlD